jgi:hypothetical protein
MGEILKVSDDGVYHLGLLDFWTLSIDRYPKEQEKPFWKLYLFPSSGASIPSRDNRNRSSFRNIVFFSFLIKISDDGQGPKTQ